MLPPAQRTSLVRGLHKEVPRAADIVKEWAHDSATFDCVGVVLRKNHDTAGTGRVVRASGKPDTKSAIVLVALDAGANSVNRRHRVLDAKPLRCFKKVGASALLHVTVFPSRSGRV